MRRVAWVILLLPLLAALSGWPFGGEGSAPPAGTAAAAPGSAELPPDELPAVGLAARLPRISAPPTVVQRSSARTRALEALRPPPPAPDPQSLGPAARATWERLLFAEEQAREEPAPDWPIALAQVPVDEPGPPLRSTSWYVVDEETGEVVTAQDAETPKPIASISKLVTALVWRTAGSGGDAPLPMAWSDHVVARRTDSPLLVGAAYAAGDVLHSMLLASDNRAAAALARSVGLPLDQFAVAMSRRARALGLRSATFAEPTGLSNDNRMCARDVARLLAVAAADPVVGPVLLETEHHYQRVDRPGGVSARQTDRLAWLEHWETRGGKTGYTDLAGSCLVVRTEIAGRKVTCAFLGAYGPDTRYGDAARLRRWMERRQARADRLAATDVSDEASVADD